MYYCSKYSVSNPFRIISMIKLRAKTEIVYESNNLEICMQLRIAGSMYYNRILETVFWDVLADQFHPQVLFLYSARMHGNQKMF